MESTLQLNNIISEDENVITTNNECSSNNNNNSILDNYNNNEIHSSINDVFITTTQLTSTYVDEIEMPGHNIIFKEPSHTIHLISIDLLIKKIIFDNFITVYPKVFKAFCTQFYVFFKPEFIISKLTSAFDYYYNTQKLSLSKILNLITFINKITLELLIQYKSLLNTYNNNIIQTLCLFYSKITTEPILNTPSTKDIHYLLTQDIPYHYKINILTKLEHPYKSIDTVIQSSLTKENDITSTKHNKRLNAFYILDWDDEDIVKQLTYISYIQLTTLQHKEFLGGNFIKSTKHQTSPTIIKLCQHFDNLVMFIIQDILSYDNASLRGTIIDKWINISYKCKQIHNYNDSFAIKQAISHYIIQKLKQSWKYVSKNAKRLHNELNVLYSFNNNFMNLRNEIKQCKGVPYIPYLGMLLRDINYYESKFNYLENEMLINCEKLIIVQDVVDAFYKFEEYAYDYVNNNTLAFFSCLLPIKEKDLEQLSNMIEPIFTLHNGNVNHNDKRLTLIDEMFFKQ